MDKIPFNKMNFLLINSSRKVWDVKHGYSISFFEYVKSQLHFPLTPYLHNRAVEDYKSVYLYLTGNSEYDIEKLDKVLKYFYYDIYNSFRLTNIDCNFELDFTGLLTLLPSKELPSGIKISDKVVALNQAYLSKESYLITGGE